MIEPKDLKLFVEEFVKDKKAENVVTIELPNEVLFTKYIVFANGRSEKNILSIAELLSIELKKQFNMGSFVEGGKNSDWVLVDIGEVVLNLFCQEAREKFKLEDFWKKKVKN